ncbi:MAG: flippase-like domain-containing protein [Candidatus Aminicenantes bacterium]|nr:flippase-like domain-containing protein [Candidatus Aminicenantes bacterium]
MAKKKIGYILLSLVVSVLFVWILLRQVDTKDFLYTFTHIVFLALLAFFAISLFGSFLRAWRYKLLLYPIKISWGNIFLVTFIRNLFVDLLPVRIGSLSYIYILNKRLDISFNTAASSFVVAFVYDFISLSPFLILAIISVGLGTTSLSTPLMLLFSILFLLIMLAVYWQLIGFCRIFITIYRIFLRVIKSDQKKWAVVSIEKLQHTVEDIVKIRKRRTDLPVFLLSLGIRAAKYGSLFFLLFALLQVHGYTLGGLSIWKTILGITGAEMTGYLPIKGIGGFGTWESGWALTLMLLGFESRIAVLSSSIHLVTNLFEYILGLLSILFLALPSSKK